MILTGTVQGIYIVNGVGWNLTFPNGPQPVGFNAQVFYAGAGCTGAAALDANSAYLARLAHRSTAAGGGTRNFAIRAGATTATFAYASTDAFGTCNAGAGSVTAFTDIEEVTAPAPVALPFSIE